MPHFTPSNCAACGGRLAVQFVKDEERDRHVCCSCGEIRYLNPHIVAGTIPQSGEKIWLLRRAIEPRYGTWTFPAGYMELGETVEDAAIRETREELGADVALGPLLGVYSRPATTSVLLVFLATATSWPKGGKEALEIALFGPSDIPWHELAFWNTAEALRAWVTKHASSQTISTPA